MYFLAKDSVWIQWMDDEILFVEPNAYFYHTGNTSYSIENSVWACSNAGAGEFRCAKFFVVNRISGNDSLDGKRKSLCVDEKKGIWPC